ncbi:type 2 lantibiotic [Butyrivibrio sp. XB500-5]|uniref:mersacidin family lantibiotic n=1 Tax=Butyrivibrio sp. XB500-5 TaxID=2364880 RepID=UPI000EA94FF3|nr:lichenicidin A2 family type 2 lantibiotic [Butyrivibrio sp. XB500-5]RKM59696.1 type 2 lantibiotic [Butyrivibrio sp. XB500-5]
MSNEKINKIIGAAFENMSFADMAKIQGAGDVDGETIKQTIKLISDSSRACATIVTAVSSMVSGYLGGNKD